MPPKAKKRHSRMHAAIDAMSPLGFSPKTVQAAVKALLKEYGGDANWPFIESDAYNVLLNSMLEEKEGDHEKELSLVGENSQWVSGEGADTLIGTTECGGIDAGTSKLALSRVCSETVDTGSHALQIVGCKNDESTSEKRLEKTLIASQPPEFLISSRVKTVTPKSENLNGWLIEDDEDEEIDLVKLNRTRKSVPLKRKHSDL